jgi:hypothetical protein
MLVQPDDPTLYIGALIKAKVMLDMSLLSVIAAMEETTSKDAVQKWYRDLL